MEVDCKIKNERDILNRISKLPKIDQRFEISTHFKVSIRKGPSPTLQRNSNAVRPIMQSFLRLLHSSMKYVSVAIQRTPLSGVHRPRVGHMPIFAAFQVTFLPFQSFFLLCRSSGNLALRSSIAQQYLADLTEFSTDH